MYIVKNKFYKITFIGGVNYEFKREGYCVQKHIKTGRWLMMLLSTTP